MTYYAEPDDVTGYALDLGETFWSIVVPDATKNLITDPSFEMGNYGANSYDDGYMGVRCYTDVNACQMLFVPTVDTIHTFSAYVKWLNPGTTSDIVISVDDGFGTVVSRTETLAYSEGWRRFSISFPVTVGADHYAIIDTVSGDQYLTDCYQVEAKSYATTYTDGDMQIWYPEADTEFYWTGEPYNSASVRTVRTRLGGRYIPFSDYGFRTLSVVGIGATPVETSFQTTFKGKSIPENILYAQRELVINGVIYGETFDILNRRRRDFFRLFQPTVVGRNDPIRLQIELTDYDRVVELYAYYIDGFEGEIVGRHQQRISVRLHTGRYPHWMSEYNRMAILPEAALNVTPQDLFFKDMETGVWGDLVVDNTDKTTFVNDIDHDAEGNIYVCGDMTDLIHKADEAGGTTGLGFDIDPGATECYDIAVSKYGPLIMGAVGDWDEVDGDVCEQVAWWDGTDWHRCGQGISGSSFSGPKANCVEYHDRYVYVGGDFAEVLNTDGTNFGYANIARYNIDDDTWEGVGAGVGASYVVNGLKIGPDGLIYIAMTYGAVSPNQPFLARYDPATDSTAWFVPYPYTALTTDAVSTKEIAFDPSGNVYFIAQNIDDTYRTQYVMSRRGASWNVDLFVAPINGDPVYPSCISISHTNNFYITGGISTWNGKTTNVHTPIRQRWASGANLTALDFNMYGGEEIDVVPPQVHTVGAKVYLTSNKLDTFDGGFFYYVNYGVPTTINYTGTAPTRGILVLHGPVSLYSLWNYTNQKQIVLETPLVVPVYARYGIYEQDGVLFWRNLTIAGGNGTQLQVNPSASDYGALDLYPGDNVLTAFYMGDGSGWMQTLPYPDFPANYDWQRVRLMWRDQFEAQ